MPIPCFWVEKTDLQVWGLRRFVSSSDEKDLCVDGSYHGALKMIGKRKSPPRPPASPDLSGFPKALRERTDWPTACEKCGRPFVDGDYFQVWTDRVYVRGDTGEEWALRDLPPGAMFDAHWMHYDGWMGADGVALTVILPVGEPEAIPWDATRHMWHVDTEATGGGRWTRTGDPRKPETLTVAPSIAKLAAGNPGYYHGFLQAGVLTDHIG